jgi:WD40 repeat protein
MLVLGLFSGQVMLVDDATGKEKWSEQAHSVGQTVEVEHPNSHTAVAMSPDGRFVASVARFDNSWKLWDAASGALHMEGATRNWSVHLPEEGGGARDGATPAARSGLADA